VLFRDGEKISESTTATEMSADADRPGTYRVEVYQDALGAPFDKMPWIISDPIYLR
jgi:hypothetical protein